MTIAELIVELGRYPQDAPVITHGEHGDCEPRLACPLLVSYVFSGGEPVCPARIGYKNAVVVVLL